MRIKEAASINDEHDRVFFYCISSYAHNYFTEPPLLFFPIGIGYSSDWRRRTETGVDCSKTHTDGAHAS